MPLSLLEAMSYGNCCLVSDIDECASVVEDKAIELMDDEKCYQKECEKMLQYSSNLGWDNVAKQLLDNLKFSKEKK